MNDDDGRRATERALLLLHCFSPHHNTLIYEYLLLVRLFPTHSPGHQSSAIPRCDSWFNGWAIGVASTFLFLNKFPSGGRLFLTLSLLALR